MPKKFHWSRHRTTGICLGLAGLWLFLASPGYCAKTDPEPDTPKTNNPDKGKNNLWGDPAATSAMVGGFNAEEKALRERQLQRLKVFAADKEKQAEKLALASGEDVSAEARRFFDAGKRGDTVRILAMYTDFMKRHRQFVGSSQDESLDTSYWAPILEVNLAYECVVPMEPKCAQFFVDDTINSIPAGSIYFGGTDSGRGLITAFTKSHADADPFFTLTQNALADGTYLTYVRRMYGEKIYIPSDEAWGKCFSDWYEDAKKRYQHDTDHPQEPPQIKPGEDIKMTDGKLEVSGLGAVLVMNDLLLRIIFDRNPEKEFYIEESFTLDWMYPYLEPHGPIMKLNRKKLDELPGETVAKDQEYWKKKVNERLGNWLTEETSVATVTRFAEKVYARKNLSGFSGDERYLQSEFAQKMVSKLRSSIGGVYDWRSQHAKSSVERDQMAKKADFAYRQAFALCPYSPEAVYRYVNLLSREGRIDDAILLAETSIKTTHDNSAWMKTLVQQLKERKKQQK